MEHKAFVAVRITVVFIQVYAFQQYQCFLLTDGKKADGFEKYLNILHEG
jgi:hypothetical protein